MNRMLNNKFFRIILCILVIASIYFVPSIFSLLLGLIGLKNEIFISIISLFMYLIILVLIFLPELKEEFKTYKDRINVSIDNGFKYWIIGLIIMIFSNVLINFVIFKGQIAANEELNRQSILNNPIWYTILSMGFVAPFIEEIIFRKSIDKIFKNNIFYYVFSALLFGFAHVIADLSTPLNLLYIIPYGSLGYVFALMDKKTNTLFTSVMMHSLHNLMTLFLLLIIL